MSESAGIVFAVGRSLVRLERCAHARDGWFTIVSLHINACLMNVFRRLCPRNLIPGLDGGLPISRGEHSIDLSNRPLVHM